MRDFPGCPVHWEPLPAVRGLGVIAALLSPLAGCSLGGPGCAPGDTVPDAGPIETTTWESSPPLLSPSGHLSAQVSSRTEMDGGGATQVVVTESEGGSGLIQFPRPQVSMRLIWKSDNHLLVQYPDHLTPSPISELNTRFGRGGQVEYQALAAGSIPPLQWTRTGVRRVLAEEALERGTLVTTEYRGRVSYTWHYYDIGEPDSHREALETRGFQGGGPSWGGIIYGLVAINAPALQSRVDVSAEASGLSVDASDRAAAVTVAELVAAAKKSPSLLETAIERAQADGRME